MGILVQLLFVVFGNALTLPYTMFVVQLPRCGFAPRRDEVGGVFGVCIHVCKVCFGVDEEAKGFGELSEFPKTKYI